MEEFAENFAGLQLTERGASGLPGCVSRFREFSENFEDFKSRTGGITDATFEIWLWGIKFERDFRPSTGGNMSKISREVFPAGLDSHESPRKRCGEGFNLEILRVDDDDGFCIRRL